jgi:hypothetical protein
MASKPKKVRRCHCIPLARALAVPGAHNKLITRAGRHRLQFKIEPFKHPLKLDPNYAGECGARGRSCPPASLPPSAQHVCRPA